jgi:ubiquinone/menaquinone biosynthesis C-methylase UbiE
MSSVAMTSPDVCHANVERIGRKWPVPSRPGSAVGTLGQQIRTLGQTAERGPAHPGRSDRKSRRPDRTFRAGAINTPKPARNTPHPFEIQRMNADLHRRLQRYGWDRAADRYERLWQAPLADARAAVLEFAALAPGEEVLDVASGTGLVAFEAARAVGARGRVLGVDVSRRMVELAGKGAHRLGAQNCRFAGMGAEALALPDGSFDVVLCALGLMYLPDPVRALREMRRVLRPGGRAVMAVWGERSKCGWSALFPIVDAEVTSEVCPLFFQLGQPGALALACGNARLEVTRQRRIATSLLFESAEDACEAAFLGGPVALAWSRFDENVRAGVRARYLEAIDAWRRDGAYAIPGEFVIIGARVPNGH